MTDQHSEPSALRRCVGDGFERSWGNEPLLTERSDPSAFSDVFGLSDLDTLVAASLRVPCARMVRDGEPVATTRYCSRTRLGGRYLDDVLDPVKVVEQLRGGSTLVLQSLHRTCPSVAEFVGDVQDEIGHPVQANAYLTPPTAAGLAPHSDGHDVIVLQLFGSKTWEVAGLDTLRLCAGDSLYVPAGTQHCAATSHDWSLHLTLGIIAVTRRQLVQHALAEVDDLDVPLPVGFRDRGRLPEVRSELDRSLAAAVAAWGDDRFGATAEELTARAARERPRPMIRGRLSSAIERSALGPETVLRWVAGPPRVRPTGDGGGRIELRAGGRVVTMPRAAADATVALAERRVCRVDRLPGLDEASQLVVADRLTLEGLCVLE